MAAITQSQGPDLNRSVVDLQSTESELMIKVQQKMVFFESLLIQDALLNIDKSA